jgi:Protein of unknown function (DUF1769)
MVSRPRRNETTHSSDTTDSMNSTNSSNRSTEEVTDTMTPNKTATTTTTTTTVPPSSSSSLSFLLRRRIKFTNVFRGCSKSHPHNNGTTTTTTSKTATGDISSAFLGDTSTMKTRIITGTSSVDEEKWDVSSIAESLHKSTLVDTTTIVIHPPCVQPQQEQDAVTINDTTTTTNNTTTDGTVTSSHRNTNEDDIASLAMASTATVDPMGSFCTIPYLERMLCGIDTRYVNDHVQRLNALPDDPSVQESIECIVTAQQDIYLAQRSQQQQQQCSPDTELVYHDSNHTVLQTPSSIQQCILKNRSISRLPPHFRRDVLSRSPRSSSSSSRNPQSWQNIPFLLEPPIISQAATSIEVVPQNGTTPYPPLKDTATANSQPTNLSKEIQPQVSVDNHGILKELLPPQPYASCKCCLGYRPILEPEDWPQRPLLMRPTPNSGTIVRGIRFSSSTTKDCLWSSALSESSASSAPSSSSTHPPTTTFELSWPDALRRHWQQQQQQLDTTANGTNMAAPTITTKDDNNSKRVENRMCSKCMILPINNGKELPGESLVTDFESDMFIGTILVRLKDCHGTTIPSREQSHGYFHGLHRRYQVVIRGRFKQCVPWTECIAGFQ